MYRSWESGWGRSDEPEVAAFFEGTVADDHGLVGRVTGEGVDADLVVVLVDEGCEAVAEFGDVGGGSEFDFDDAELHVGADAREQEVDVVAAVVVGDVVDDDADLPAA